MSYAGTKAQSGLGATISIGTSAVLIGEITGVKQSGKVNKTDDATNLQSQFEEFIATIPNGGNWDITVNRVWPDAGQAALTAAFNTSATAPFAVTLRLAPGQTTTGDKIAFNAIVEEFDDVTDIAPAKKISSTFKLKVSGLPVLTVGS